MSTRPDVSRAAATTFSASAARVRSAVINAAFPPAAIISLAVAASSASVRAVRKTEAPSFAKSCAIARPIPRPEPVIKTTLCSRSMAFSVLSCGIQPILHANQPLSRATICPSSNGAPRCHLEGRAVCAPKDLNAHPENSLARFSPIWEAAPGTLKLQGYDRCRKHHHALRLTHPLRGCDHNIHGRAPLRDLWPQRRGQVHVHEDPDGRTGPYERHGHPAEANGSPAPGPVCLRQI